MYGKNAGLNFILFYFHFILFFLLFTTIITTAQSDDQITESSGEKFNTRGFYDNNFAISKGKEITSDYDGNFMLQYSTHLKYPDELDGNFTIIYNANVGHRIFFEEWMRADIYDVQSAPRHAGYKFNAPEWILGYKGIALQTLNFETNLFKPNNNVPDEDEYEVGYEPENSSTIKSEVPLLIPGYSYTNKLSDRDYDNRNSGCLSTLPDIIQILRADGSIIELENNELDKTEGLYIEKGVNKYGFAIVKRSFPGNVNDVSRTMWYKPGDGLTYKFVEEFIRFGNCNSPDDEVNTLPEKTNILTPTVMYLTEILSPGNTMSFNYLHLSENDHGYGRKFFQSISVNANVVDYYDNELTMQYGYGSDNRMHSLAITNNNNDDNIKLELDAYTNSVEDLFSDKFYYDKTRRYRVNKIIDALEREDIITYTLTENEEMRRDYYEGEDHLISYMFYLPSQINYLTDKITKLKYYPAYFDEEVTNEFVFLDRYPQYSESNMTFAKRDCFTNFMLKKRELFDNNNQIKTEQYNYTSDGTWTKEDFKSKEVNNIYSTVTVNSYNGFEPNDEFELFKNFTKRNSYSISGDVYDHGSRISLEFERKEDLSNTGKKIEKTYKYDDDYNTDYQSCNGRYYFIMETFYLEKITERKYTNSTNIFRESVIDYIYENLEYKWNDIIRTKKIKKQQTTTDPLTLETLQTYINIFPTADLSNYNESQDNTTYYFNLQLPEKQKIYSNSLIKSHTNNTFNLSGVYAGRLTKTIEHYGTDREIFNNFAYSAAQNLQGFISLKENDKGVKTNFYYPTGQNGVLQASANGKIIKTDGYDPDDELGFTHVGYQVKPFRSKNIYMAPDGNSIEMNTYTAYNRQNKPEFSIDKNSFYSDYFYDDLARVKKINLPGSFVSSLTPFSNNYSIGVINYEVKEDDFPINNDDDTYLVQDYHYESNDGTVTQDKKRDYYTYFENEINPQDYDINEIAKAALLVEVQTNKVSEGEDKAFYLQGISTPYPDEYIPQNGSGPSIWITLPDSSYSNYLNIAIDISSILNTYKDSGEKLYGIKFRTTVPPVPEPPDLPVGTTHERTFIFRGNTKCAINYLPTANPDNGFIVIDGSEHSKSSYVYSYDDANKIVFSNANFIKDENDDTALKQKYEFDALGQLIIISTKNNSGSYIPKQTNSYNFQGLIEDTETGTGVNTVNEYNFLGQITKSTLEDLPPKEVKHYWNGGTETNGGYTATYFEKIVYEDENNKIRTEFFDKVGNKVAEKLDNNTATIFEYDDIYRLKKVISPESKETIYTYDELGYLSSRTTPDEGKYEYKYDKWGNLRFTYHEASGPDLLFHSYDALNRLITTGIYKMYNDEIEGPHEAIPDEWDEMDPDSDDNFDETDENLWVVRNVYDQYTNEGIFSAVPPESVIDFNNYKGRLAETAFRDKPGDAWNYKIYHYDYLGRIKKFQVKYGNNDWKDITNEYDHQGNLTKQNINAEHYIWNEYDVQSRLTEVKSHSSDSPSTAKTEAIYNYNAADQITKLGGSNYSDLDIGKVDYTYDNRGRLKSIANFYEYTPQDVERRFYENLTYYDNNNIATQNIENENLGNLSNLNFTYSYDGLNRLTQSDCSDNNYSLSWIYDNDGNITLVKNPNSPNNTGNYYSYDVNNNQLLYYLERWGGGASNIILRYLWNYDEKGRVVKKTTDKQKTPMSFSITFDEDFNYNYLNLPIKVTEYLSSGTDPNPDNYYYKYDDQGMRIAKEIKIDGNTTENEYYLRDHTGREVAIYNNGGTTLKSINLFGNGLLGYATASGSRYYYIKDHLGSIRQVRNGSNTVASKNYQPYGSIIAEYNSGTDYRYDFTEKQRDKETDFNYFGARYYDSDIGRWTSVDPLAHLRPGLSPYQYAQNNPLNRIDPTGMLDEGGEDESIWNRLSRLLRLAGNSSHIENPGTQMTESIVSGVNNQINSAVDNMESAINSLSGKTVDATIQVADAVSDGSTIVAAAGVIVTAAGAATGNPVLAGVGVEITSTSIAVGTGADITSTVAKGIDAYALVGSKMEFYKQAGATTAKVISGGIINSTTERVVTRTGLSNIMFRGASGRFVSNSMGFGVTATSDATKVAIGFGL